VKSQCNYTISSLKANLIAIPVSIAILFLFILVYMLIWEGFSVIAALNSTYLKFQVFLPVFIILVFLHEAIHWLSFRIVGKIASEHCRLGFQWKTITPFAHCTVPMPASAYKISLILPALILGIIPSLTALAFGIPWLLIYGILFTITGGGDFIILWLIRKVNKGQLLQDHPTRCGCEIITS